MLVFIFCFISLCLMYFLIYFLHAVAVVTNHYILLYWIIVFISVVVHWKCLDPLQRTEFSNSHVTDCGNWVVPHWPVPPVREHAQRGVPCGPGTRGSGYRGECGTWSHRSPARFEITVHWPMIVQVVKLIRVNLLLHKWRIRVVFRGGTGHFRKLKN